jgi:drug/metabolite transporter (DMT)-like permease
MLWFLIAVASYFLLAIVNLTDKFLIDNVLRSSKTYAFSVCLLGSIIFLAAPWFLVWPGLHLFLANLLTGALFALALYFLYEALIRGEAAKTVIIIGGLIPVFSTIFSLILGESFFFTQLISVILLLIGTFLIAYLPDRHAFWEKLWNFVGITKNEKNSMWLIVLSSFYYSLFFMSSKIVYSNQDFWSSFMWVRLGALLTVLFFLFDKKSRLEIFKNLGIGQKKKKQKKQKNIFLFLFNQALGSLSFILQNYAIFLGPVAIITALQGVQYAVMIFLAFFLGFFFKEYKEKFSWRLLGQKTIAIIFISIGLYFISLNL